MKRYSLKGWCFGGMGLTWSTCSLPLHSSQQEIAVKEGEYSDFEYYLCFTPELTSQLLAMGEKVEVREPQELKDSLLKRICATWKRYK